MAAEVQPVAPPVPPVQDLDAAVGQRGPQALEGTLPVGLFRFVRLLRAMCIELSPAPAAATTIPDPESPAVIPY